jgi:hypothetical protein
MSKQNDVDTLTEEDIENIISKHNIKIHKESNASTIVKEDKVNIFKKIWDKTIFPDMIKNKKEEKDLLNKIKHEARLEAMSEMKGDLKEDIKKKEIDKIKGKGKSDWLSKIAKNLAAAGENAGNPDRIGSMLGVGKSNPGDNVNNMFGIGNQNKQPEVRYVEVPTKKKNGKKKIVKKVYQQQPQNNTNNFEDKIKKFMQ